jgi:hypothetical protein
MYYEYGQRAALQKLGMGAAPIPYAGASTPTNDMFSANKRQDIWSEVDSTPIAMSGEESAQGMPSAPKSASYTGVVAQGSGDGFRGDPERKNKFEDGVRRAFQSNADIDNSTTSEPGFASPKLANSFFNIGKGLRPSSLGPRSTSSLMGKTSPSMPKPGGNLNASLNPMKSPVIKPPTPMQPNLARGAHMSLMGSSVNSPMHRFTSPL